jgi:C2 domain
MSIINLIYLDSFFRGDGHHAQTEVSVPNQNPIWNATLSFDIGNGQNLIDRSIEVALWDLVPQTESVFLGECTVDLQRAFIDDRAVWYRLEDPKNLRVQTMAKCNISFNVSPRGSTTLLSCDVSRFIRRNDYGFQRSVSDDCDSIGESTSLLHPDTAWLGSSRRGSSQSETLEIETYQLGKDFSKSLPGSRRYFFFCSFPDKLEGVNALVISITILFILGPPSRTKRRKAEM